MADFPFQYAAKFLCTSNIPDTSQTTTSLLPGHYQTVVNIHNPNSTTIRFRMKLALASLANPQISDFLDGALRPDQAGKIDCSDLQNFGLKLIHGFEGFLVIESTHSLDVVAVYTAGTTEGVTSMDVERVFERYLT
jgi:hypothetical protein